MSSPQPTADDLRDTAAFDALMWAMARPGSIHRLPHGVSDLALALLDRETRAYVEDPALGLRVAATGARLVAPDLADHAFCATAAGAAAALSLLPVGSPLYPDEGATLVMPATLGTGIALRLTGPGIDGHADLRLSGLPDGFFAQRSARCRYPEGIDIILFDGQRIVALPRSTAVEVL